MELGYREKKNCFNLLTRQVNEHAIQSVIPLQIPVDGRVDVEWLVEGGELECEAAQAAGALPVGSRHQHMVYFSYFEDLGL